MNTQTEALSNYNAIKAAHDDLVAALTMVGGVLETYLNGEGSRDQLVDLAKRIDAALAKAGYAVRN